MFGKGKINRESTPAEKVFESGLSGEARENYAALNLESATNSVRESTPKGWSVNPFGRSSTDMDR